MENSFSIQFSLLEVEVHLTFCHCIYFIAEEERKKGLNCNNPEFQ